MRRQRNIQTKEQDKAPAEEFLVFTPKVLTLKGKSGKLNLIKIKTFTRLKTLLKEWKAKL